MKILLSSHCFYPSTGGIETSSMLYARELAALGNEVIVVTQTPYSEPEEKELGFKIVRTPPIKDLISLHLWSDVVFHNNISLRSAWPLLFIKRPWFVIHQTWLGDHSVRSEFLEPLKRWFCRFAKNMVLSTPMRDALGMEADVVGNPYDDKVFKTTNLNESRKGMVFVGRLVSDKGIDIALKAVSKAAAVIPDVSLDVIGEGNERTVLEKMAEELNLKGEVHFLGKKTGGDLAEQLNRYEIAIIPSRWNEPFGIVALEALACGCVLVTSRGGGLPEAVGECGILFENGNVDELAKKILGIYRDPDLKARLRANVPAHLAKYSPKKMAKDLQDRFNKALKQL